MRLLIFFTFCVVTVALVHAFDSTDDKQRKSVKNAPSDRTIKSTDERNKGQIRKSDNSHGWNVVRPVVKEKLHDKTQRKSNSNKLEKASQDGKIVKHKKASQDGKIVKHKKASQDGKIVKHKEEASQDGKIFKHKKASQKGKIVKHKKTSQNGKIGKHKKASQDGKIVKHKEEASQDGKIVKHKEEASQDGKIVKHKKTSQDGKISKHKKASQDGKIIKNLDRQSKKSCAGACVADAEDCADGKIIKSKCNDGLKCCISDERSVMIDDRRKVCRANKKCTKKRGSCQPRRKCRGSIAKGKLCTGGCACCVSQVSSCKTKSSCTRVNGECQPLSQSCSGQWHTGKQFCKGSGCGCCSPTDVLWSYSGATGPSSWSTTFPTCGGANQSPINIVTSEVKGSYPWRDFGFKNYDVTPVNATLTNNGHSAQVSLGQVLAPTVQGGVLTAKYTFLQFHFHWGSAKTMGSEHTIDGKRYPAELHMVHYKTAYGTPAEAVTHSDGLAVLAIFLEIGPQDNPNLKSIIQGLPFILHYDTQHQIAPFPLRYLLPTNLAEFYSYQGSLTTPPCSEIVTWIVFKTPISISLAQLALFWELFGEDENLLLDNFRPTYPIGSRTVYGGSISPLWGYEGETGPGNWAKNFPMCGGKAQSPIDIVINNALPTILLPITFTNYDARPTKIVLVNNGHTALVSLTMAAGVGLPTINNGGLAGDYTFAQFHFHWGKTDLEGSEHTINGAKFPGELHLVHYKTQYGSLTEAVNHADGLAVLGILLSIGQAHNPKLAPLITGLSQVHEANTNTTLATFALQDLLPANAIQLFRYQGSLTTPTCNEVVTWLVLSNTLPISAAQLEEFRKLEEVDGRLLEHNFRPVQPLNGRQVYTKI